MTIFRLLLNVEPSVRNRAIAFAAAALPDVAAGLLVVQNHGNRRSLRHLGRRRHAGDSWFRELAESDIAELLAGQGFRIVGRKGCAMFPQGWYQRRMTRPVVRAVDGALCGMRIFDRYAVDVLYLAVRDQQAPATAGS